MTDEIQNPDVPTPEHPAAADGPAVAKRATRANVPAPPIKLQAYEGPLDLLLDLIRQQQINIYDIPIATITQQYLDSLKMLEELNIDVAGEFILTAATLIYIKSRMLLPADPEASAEEQEDPRAELVHRLLEHEQFKNAAEMLASKRTVEEAAWTQPGLGEFSEAEDEPGLAVSVFDLISTFRLIVERAKKRTPLEIRRDEVTIAEMVEHVKQVLGGRSGPVPLEDLLAGYVWRQALIALLLALLELVRLRAIGLRQKDLFAPITVVKSRRFAEIVSGVDAHALEQSLEELE